MHITISAQRKVLVHLLDGSKTSLWVEKKGQLCSEGLFVEVAHCGLNAPDMHYSENSNCKSTSNIFLIGLIAKLILQSKASIRNESRHNPCPIGDWGGLAMPHVVQAMLATDTWGSQQAHL